MERADTRLQSRDWDQGRCGSAAGEDWCARDRLPRPNPRCVFPPLSSPRSLTSRNAGGPPNGRFSLTPEGHETHFAVQCLSRFGLAYLLAKSGTLKESIVSVCAPGGANGKAPNLEDLELIQANEKGKFGLLASGANDSAIMDGIVAVRPSSLSFAPPRTHPRSPHRNSPNPSPA